MTATLQKNLNEILPRERNDISLKMFAIFSSTISSTIVEKHSDILNPLISYCVGFATTIYLNRLATHTTYLLEINCGLKYTSSNQVLSMIHVNTKHENQFLLNLNLVKSTRMSPSSQQPREIKQEYCELEISDPFTIAIAIALSIHLHCTVDRSRRHKLNVDDVTITTWGISHVRLISLLESWPCVLPKPIRNIPETILQDSKSNPSPIWITQILAPCRLITCRTPANSSIYVVLTAWTFTKTNMGYAISMGEKYSIN